MIDEIGTRNAAPAAESQAARPTRAAKIAGTAIAILALAVGCVTYHAWNRGALDEAKDAAPDGINLEPIAGSPGAYLVNPAYEAVLSVALVELRLPKPGDAPRRVTALDDKEWSYDDKAGVLSLTRPIDDEAYMVRANGHFRYPLSFRMREGLDPASIRLLVDGKIGIDGVDYRFDPGTGVLTLLGTSPDTGWFGFSFAMLDGVSSGAIGDLGADRLTRAMRAHLGFPVDGNCAAVGDDGRLFRAPDDEAGEAPWLIELLPIAEGYVGAYSLSDGFRFDAATGIIELDEPIDPARFAVYAHMD